MIVAGLMIAVGSLFLHLSRFDRATTVAVLTFGIGVIGVGVFPGDMDPHPLFAMMTFISGGIAAILSYRAVKGPLKYIFPIMGVTALVFLFFSQAFIPHLGDGGTERWVAYPILFWLTGFGGYVLGSTAQLWYC
jgi:hypothetical membrane protein